MRQDRLTCFRAQRKSRKNITCSADESLPSSPAFNSCIKKMSGFDITPHLSNCHKPPACTQDQQAVRQQGWSRAGHWLRGTTCSTARCHFRGTRACNTCKNRQQSLKCGLMQCMGDLLLKLAERASTHIRRKQLVLAGGIPLRVQVELRTNVSVRNVIKLAPGISLAPR